MYRCVLKGVEKLHQYEELIKVFLPKGEYEIWSESPEETGSDAEADDDDSLFLANFDGDRDKLRRSLYESLARYTGKRPRWGTLTGIRPVKLAGEIYDSCGSMEDVENILSDRYLVDESKVRLTVETLRYQRQIIGRPPEKSVSVYIGIPFCPTRCLYCSFTSNQVSDDEVERYLEALYREIDYCGENLRRRGLSIESMYIGGGTPTSLDESQLEKLLDRIEASFGLKGIGEFTVEAGRPDTFTEKKLKIIKEAGAGRISINPQTMKQETLDLFGRRHTVEDTVRAFELAKRVGIACINTDLIAGLPGENAADFRDSLERIWSLGADNITLHTLAVKRGSGLKELDQEYNYKNEELCTEMLDDARLFLTGKCYRPYYLYRQKHTSGNTENLGFCRADSVSIYNVRIMEEAQSILALGAGGISKVYFPEENRLERVANVSNYQIYIDRIDEMIERKEKEFWR